MSGGGSSDRKKKRETGRHRDTVEGEGKGEVGSSRRF